MFSKVALAAGFALFTGSQLVSPKPAGGGGPLTDADLARLEREATARAQKVAVDGGPQPLAAEIARELATIGQYEDFYLVGDYAAAYRNFPGETVAAFRSIDVEIQYHLLLWSWRRFAFEAMVPVLKSLYQSPPEDYTKMRDLALRRFFDLAPDQARPFMLDELQRTDLRVSMTTLRRLNDASFPDFEAAWLRNLENGILDERIDAAVRIERFGSVSIRAEVRKLYDASGDSWSCDVQRAVLGYLVRAGAAARDTALNAECRVPAAPRPSVPAKPVIVVGGPVPGDEQRIRYTIGDQVCESTQELIDWLQPLPAGSTVAWTYASNTAATHPERWPQSERDALLARLRNTLDRIKLEPLNP